MPQLNWPSVIPRPSQGVLDALKEEARKYSNCGPLGVAQLVNRWLLMHSLPLPKTVPALQRKVPLIITLTTIPSRLPKIKATLNSLLRQSVRADGVVLCLPETSRRQGPYTIPRFVKKTQAVTLLRCDKDWGPATKLIPSWLRWRDRPVRFLAVDDDNVYPHNFVETFLHWSEVHPEAALGYRGHVFQSPRSWKSKGTLYGTHTNEPYQVDLLTGTWGFLIRDSFLDTKILDYDAYPEGAFYVDDIWFNGHLARKGIKRVLIPASHPPLPTHSAYKEALGVDFNAEGVYDDEMIAAFADSWEQAP